MDRKPITKARALYQLAKSVAKWDGKESLGGGLEKRIWWLMESIAGCALGDGEVARLAACRHWFAKARDHEPPEVIREAWLIELWCWDHLVGIGAGIDCTIPRQPWRSKPPAKGIPYKDAWRYPRHYVSVYPMVQRPDF